MTSRRSRSTSIGTVVIQELQSKVEHLRGRVAVLEEEVGSLKASPQEKLIVLRTVSREQAKQEVQELFGSGETLFYSDIAQRLQLELSLVVELCQELKAEGEIEVCDDAV